MKKMAEYEYRERDSNLLIISIVGFFLTLILYPVIHQVPCTNKPDTTCAEPGGVVVLVVVSALSFLTCGFAYLVIYDTYKIVGKKYKLKQRTNKEIEWEIVK